MPTYPYRLAPAGLLTMRQLRARGLRPGGQDITAQILWRHRKQRRIAYLYREDQAKPKRDATAAQLAAISKALKHGVTAPHAVTRSPIAYRAPGANAMTAPRGGTDDTPAP